MLHDPLFLFFSEHFKDFSTFKHWEHWWAAAPERYKWGCSTYYKKKKLSENLLNSRWCDIYLRLYQISAALQNFIRTLFCHIFPFIKNKTEASCVLNIALSHITISIIFRLIVPTLMKTKFQHLKFSDSCATWSFEEAPDIKRTLWEELFCVQGQNKLSGTCQAVLFSQRFPVISLLHKIPPPQYVDIWK